MTNYEILTGVVSNCESIQIGDNPALRCLVGNKAVTIMTARIAPEIFDGDEIKVAIVDVAKLGGKLGIAYRNITRDQRQDFPYAQMIKSSNLMIAIGVIFTPVLIGLVFLLSGLKTKRLGKEIQSAAIALD